MSSENGTSKRQGADAFAKRATLMSIPLITHRKCMPVIDGLGTFLNSVLLL